MGRKILRIPARLDHLVQIRNFVEITAAQSHFQARDIQDFVQAVDEAATNIIRHGYQGEPGEIEVEAVPSEDGLCFMLRDQAYAFDPTKILQPDLSAPLEKRPLGKLGLVFIRLMVDEVSYQRLGEGVNQLSLWKKRKNEKSKEG